MRASPPIEVTLNRFGWWRGALALLGSTAGAVMAAWIATSHGQHATGLIAAAAAMTLAAVASAVACARVRPFDLRWNGMRWQLAAQGRDFDEPLSGDLQVPIDLGFWMLLRFVADLPDGAGRVIWLPVQRRGLEPQWHALRCAVHAPQPASGAP
ncbi:MAG: hypothetical protein M3Y67_05620 [Pseudomonadota bacterium]|nr:hypothetical protein [Pseudomonadota bacterium]